MPSKDCHSESPQTSSAHGGDAPGSHGPLGRHLSTARRIDTLEAQNEELRQQLGELGRQLDQTNGLLMSLLETCKHIAEDQQWTHVYANPELAINVRRDPHKAQLLIVGYYGASNLGDELMLETVLHYLRESPQIETTVMLSGVDPIYEDPFLDTSRYGNVHVIHDSRTVTDYNVLAHNYDCLLIGGGALLVQGTHKIFAVNRIGLAYTLTGLARSFLALDKPCFAWGQSAEGSIEDKELADDVSFMVERFRSFTVRDPYSIETFAQAGAPKEHMILCDDIVAAHPRLSQVRPVCWDKRDRSVTISWMCFDGQRPQLVALLGALLQELDVSAGERIVLVPFFECAGIDRRGNDTRFFESVLEEISPALGSISVAHPDQTMEDTCQILSSARCGINMRYHGAYIDGLLATPSITIENDLHPHYGNKMRQAAETFPGQSLVRLSQMDVQDIARKVASYLRIDPHLDVHVPQAVAERARKTLQEETEQLVDACALG